MLTDRIEPAWIDAFEEVFTLCKIRSEETVAILSETQSRPLNVHLAELALARMGLSYFNLQVPTPRAPAGPVIRSSGASVALTGQTVAVKALADAEISVLAIHQCMRQVDIQFVIDEDAYDRSIAALHGVLIEPHNHEYAIVAA